MLKNNVCAEFEQQKSVLIIWPHAEYATKNLNNFAVSAEIVLNLLSEVEVIISCYDEALITLARKFLNNYGVNCDKIRFVSYPVDIAYPRDFGAETVFDPNGDIIRIDFRFSNYGYGSEDDEESKIMRKFSEFHAKQENINSCITANIISEGGDHEFNGDGIMMAIKDTECKKRNPLFSVDEVENEFKRLFGVEKIIWIPKCTYDDEHMYDGVIPNADGNYLAYRSASANGHIDEMCRFVSKDTILIAEVTQDEADKSILCALNKERLDMALEVVKQARNQYGQPFKIVRIPVPESKYVTLKKGDDAYSLWDDRQSEINNGVLNDGTPFPKGDIVVLPAMSYCNFLIVNNKILAQKYYREGDNALVKAKDLLAYAALKSVFPNKEIIMIDTLALNIYGGGIHCHTKNISFKKSLINL